MELNASEARQIVKALRSGATPSEFADRVFVGQRGWFGMAEKMMTENAEDHHFEVRFVKAAYGGGKTLFVRRLQANARKQDWATAYILFRHGKVELDKPHTLAAELAEQVDLGETGRGLSVLLRAALEQRAKPFGIVPGRTSTLAAHDQFEGSVRDMCARKGFRHDVGLALRAASRMLIKGDRDKFAEIAEWLSGSSRSLSIVLSARDQTLKPLGIGASEELIRLMAELVLMCGKRGLYIAFDEVELISSLPSRRRANAFQTLRALVDQNDPHTLPPATSIFLAATPQMFEDPAMFPSYKALQDRIESLPAIDGTRSVNYRANVIDLGATELSREELTDLGSRICNLWARSGESLPSEAQSRVEDIAIAVAARKDYVIAKPRLFCRLVIDMLDGNLGSDIAAAAATRAMQIFEARTRELTVQ
jgi:hypothetical protein